MPSSDSADALREVWMEGYNKGLTEAGRKSADRADKAQDEVTRLAVENATLRKRVEELEQHEKETHETLGAILGTDDALHVLAAKLRERAEKAERERDNYRRDFDAAAHACDTLQADLDAALLVIVSSEVERIKALLEKRRNRG